MSEKGRVREIFTIVKSMGTNYPVLKSWGLNLKKLLVVVSTDGCSQNIVEQLSGAETPRLNERMDSKEVEKILMSTNSELVIYMYSPSRKGMDFFSFLVSIVKLGEISGKRINAMPLVVADEIPKGAYMEDFFSIFIDAKAECEVIKVEDVVPTDEALPVVQDRICTLISGESGVEEKAFLAAVCFMYPKMMENGLEREFEELMKCARQLVLFNDENQDANNLGEVFVRELYHWQEQTEFNEIYLLPNLGMDVLGKIDSVILYDGNFVFMKEKLFEEIVKSLLKVFSCPVMKKALVEEGVLCTENTRTNTVKMGYYNLAGEYQRERMLKFRRERLCIAGEMEFVELCDMKKGGCGNESC